MSGKELADQVLADYAEREGLRKQINAGNATEEQFDELLRFQDLPSAHMLPNN